ncbi:MAG: hypothetical protein JJU09_07530 [Rhodobacteraceae bacterium]|nr:hypothetical protein [Paracoccaceae bacterium]
MVDTRRLEKLIGPPRSPEAEADPRLPAPAAPRALALSGHRGARRVGVVPRREQRRTAEVLARWQALDSCSAPSETDRAQEEFNALARRPDITSRFDVLRTQLVQAFRSRGLVSLGISAPRRGNGASFVMAGLLSSLARRDDLHVVALDLNLSAPALHRYVATRPQHRNGDLLDGTLVPAECLQRLTDTVAIAPALASDDERIASVSAEDLSRLLARIRSEYAPDIILCDLPPLLAGEPAISLSMGLDAMLLVADSATTRASDIAACERLLAEQTAFLGVVLNQYQGSAAH